MRPNLVKSGVTKMAAVGVARPAAVGMARPAVRVARPALPQLLLLFRRRFCSPPTTPPKNTKTAKISESETNPNQSKISESPNPNQSKISESKPTPNESKSGYADGNRGFKIVVARRFQRFLDYCAKEILKYVPKSGVFFAWLVNSHQRSISWIESYGLDGAAAKLELKVLTPEEAASQAAKIAGPSVSDLVGRSWKSIMSYGREITFTSLGVVISKCITLTGKQNAFTNWVLSKFKVRTIEDVRKEMQELRMVFKQEVEDVKEVAVVAKQQVEDVKESLGELKEKVNEDAGEFKEFKEVVGDLKDNQELIETKISALVKVSENVVDTLKKISDW